jgi:PIN domain nuclease of toxin-antitoxin system
MRILLGTCAFPWFISGDPSLPEATKQAVQDPTNEVLLSVVSLWEITIKHALGKLPLPQTPDAYIPMQRKGHRIESLSLEESAVQRLAALPMIHRDPFDRMLVCQCQEHGLNLASSDTLFRQYPGIQLL